MPDLAVPPEHQIPRDRLAGVELLLRNPRRAGFGERARGGGAPEEVLALGRGERGVVLQGVGVREGVGVGEGGEGEGGGPEEGRARGAGSVFAGCERVC